MQTDVNVAKVNQVNVEYVLECKDGDHDCLLTVTGWSDPASGDNYQESGFDVSVSIKGGSAVSFPMVWESWEALKVAVKRLKCEQQEDE